MRLRRAGILLALSALAAVATSHAARADELSRGVVLENVVSREDPEQTYALYLPSAYTPEKSWPIIYAFDPGARGKLPVELFREVAERDGFIVAGSNNSRNGAGVPLQKILTTLWDDTHARLSLDARRTYAAGFSGGARVACAFAYFYENRVAGVIGCGASFPANIRPSRSTPFAFYGIVGVDDFNYFELKDLDRALEDFGIAHRVQTLAGGHDWPPASACAEAIEWMELQERKRAGGAQRDEKPIEEFFKRELERARAAEESGRTFEVYLGYATLAADFRGLRDVSEFEKKAAMLKDSKEVRRAVRDEQEQKERQRVLDENLERLINAPVDAADPTASRTEFRDFVSDLLKDSAGQKDSSERRVARRVLAGAYVGLLQEASEAYRLKDYKLAAFKMETAAELRPEDPNVFVFIARLYSLRGDRKSALAALRRAVKSGLEDAATLEQNKDFEALRDEPEFKKLVESLRGRAQ